ncbi:ABC transporter substrate-binding protein [Rubellicoccus peritrichatus]|uniref:histidine kinase n=1 Tax=Rubellicoccus peritrichatus TaxID=3080537 RepID=A0AAQ3L9X2_9BACT|nr:ABC transporter substrate-binding protein [Puniceicoccus sp. CR14]WOO41796.1 ABC transporter substrate-binding protein [Puniceicoccus sp. CR14]
MLAAHTLLAAIIRFHKLLILLGAYLFVSTSPGLAQVSDKNVKPLEQVKVQLKWLHQFQFAGYYAAIEQGYYKEAGLDVELLEGRPDVDPADIVLEGKADFGVGTPDLLLSHAEGDPIVVLAVIFQHSPYVFIATKESGIDDINDFAGKRIMIEPQSAELYAYLKRERIPLDSIEILPHSFSVDDLLNGTADAMSAYSTTEPFELTEAEVPYSVFSPRASGVDFYGDCLFTTHNLVEQRPELTKRFLDATLKGWSYAMENPEEVIDLILREYTQRRSRGALQFEAEKMLDLMHSKLIPVGYMYPGRWQHISDAYTDLGMLKKPVDLEAFLYDSDPKHDYTWLYWLSGTTLIIAGIAFGILLPVWRLNQKLRQEIEEHKKTEALLVKAKDEAERANLAKQEFMAQVSHDLRTPLNSILGFSEVMMDNENDIERRENLRAINASGQCLLTLVEELLDINQVESGQIELANKAFLIDDAIDPVIELMSIAAQRKNLDLVCWIESPLRGNLRGDPDRLRQMLFNLVGNAIKFTDEGSISIIATQSKPGWANIIVADTGPGIPNEILGRIFEPFVRANDFKDRQGSGLGLTIVRRFAEAMGGTIEAKNASEGANFVLSLPIAVDSINQAEDTLLKIDLKGLSISISFCSELQTTATLANLQSLGAIVSVAGDDLAKSMNCNILITDEKDTEIVRAFEKTEKPVIYLNDIRPLATRQLLAKSILASIGVAH